MSDEAASLYQRLGGYDAIAAVVDDLLPRLTGDEQLGRFWQYRPTDSVRREKQLLIDYLCQSTGGPLLYVGRNMSDSHLGMGVNAADWNVFVGHLKATLDKLSVGETEQGEVIGFIEGLRGDIVED